MQIEHLTVTGMTCGGCVTKVTRAIKVISGVGDIKLVLSSGDATVSMTNGLPHPSNSSPP